MNLIMYERQKRITKEKFREKIARGEITEFA